MHWYRWIGFAAGAGLVALTWQAVVVTLLLPRRGSSRILRYVGWGVTSVFGAAAGRFSRYETRDRVMAYAAPFFFLVLLAVWVILFLAGFALLAWPFVTGGGFIHALVLSGSSLFTLGFAADPGAGARAVVLAAAATGLAVVALLIAYLPVIYQAFNRRETLVTMLEARAGAPSWGPELLARHELIDALDSLGPLYAQWEMWAADLAESHQTYPVLLWFRSPHAQRSWIIGLLSVLDAAAIQLSTQPLSAPVETRPLLRMGYVALREIAVAVGMKVEEDPKPDDPIRLSRQSFMDAMHHLEHVGWKFERDLEDAWIHFRGWRVNYEAVAYRIAYAVNAPPALWSGPRARLPEDLQPPQRPPHREPPKELVDIKHVTRKRRAIRAGELEPVSRSVHADLHAGDDDADAPVHDHADADHIGDHHTHDAEGHDALADPAGVGDDETMVAEPDDVMVTEPE